MKTIRKFLCAVLSVILVLSALTACSGRADKSGKTFNTASSDSIPSDTVAANSDFELIWEDDAKCVMLKNIKTGKIWSTVPYEYYLSGGTSANVNSGLNITVSNSQTFQWDNVNGFSEAFLNGSVIGEKVDGGIKITYYFDKYEISVPVVYRLRDDSVEITIDSSEIGEGDNYLLVSVTPAPFLCSAVNSQSDSYLFIPTGSGALMYTDERAGAERKYSGEVFGEDAARLLTEDLIDDEAIRIPVFGARDKSSALLAIIEDNAEAAYINAMAGNSRTGYSNAYAEFYVRGYDKIKSGTQILKYDDIAKVSEELSRSKIKMGFYPLDGTDASYTGMARRYKRYLTENKLINEGENKTDTFGVNITGGVMAYATKLGFPGEKLNVMTTFSEAEKIISELEGISEMLPEVCLTGFGRSGIMPGRVGGGFDFPSVFGSKKQHLQLEKLCADKGIGLFTDFDLIRFSSSGNGFTAVFDTAKSATLQAVKRSPVQIPLRSFDTENKYRLLKRERLETAVQKLISAASRYSVSGVSLSTLGSTAYSDYSNAAYYTKGGAAAETAKYINQIAEKGHRTAAHSANAYAAALSDAVFDAPIDNGGYNDFDASIPFYSMVFGKGRNIYSSPLNEAGNYQKQIMLSAIGGTRLSFSLINDFDISCMDIQTQRFYSSVFGNNRELIKQTLEKYEPFYKAISGAGVQDYVILSGNISKTVFDNGVVLYANHNAAECDSPAGKLTPYGIIWSETEKGAAA